MTFDDAIGLLVLGFVLRAVWQMYFGWQNEFHDVMVTLVNHFLEDDEQTGFEHVTRKEFSKMFTQF